MSYTPLLDNTSHWRLARQPERRKRPRKRRRQLGRRVRWIGQPWAVLDSDVYTMIFMYVLIYVYDRIVYVYKYVYIYIHTYNYIYIYYMYYIYITEQIGMGTNGPTKLVTFGLSSSVSWLSSAQGKTSAGRGGGGRRVIC